jgi:hypothetical protein
VAFLSRRADNPGMSRSAKATSDCPEFAVTREAFNRYFEKPLPPSTFHDFVNKGKIVPMKSIRGLFLLNDSLRRLGLKEVRELPQPPPEPGLEGIVRLAFFLIDPKLFPEPSWLLPVEAIDAKDADHAVKLADTHRDKVQSYEHVELKLAHFQGVLDWASMEASGKF